MSEETGAAEFHAGRRLAGLIAAGQLPADLLRQAALGRLALSFPDRLLILVLLAQGQGEAADTARATVEQIPGAETARVLARPDCPAEIREFFCLGGAAPADGGLGESFALVEASAEEQAELAAPAASRSLLNELAGMNVQERARRATLGTRDERTILIRDANRLVQRAVLASPRLTEQDVEQIAAMRNVDDQVLREIGGSRRWRRSLNIIRNLANNPRTPTEIALQLCRHLFPNDLRRLAVNHNVQETVRRGAARLLAQKET